MGKVLQISTGSELPEATSAGLAQDLIGIAEKLIATANNLGATPIGLQAVRANRSLPALSTRRDVQFDPLYLKLAKEMYRERRARQAFIPAELLGEPAWDIMLDLFIAAIEGKFVSVTSACIGSDVPSTTALRWLTVLEDRQLVERAECVADKRRSFVRITDSGFAKMHAFFSRECRGAPRT